MDNKRIIEIKNSINKYNAQLLVVSKRRPLDKINAIYELGFRDMGENRVQDLMDKKDELPQDIKWHVIGHLQKNKVKYIAPFVELIHSVDSFKLLKIINKEAIKNERTIPVLLQYKIAEEDSKFGLEASKNEIADFMALYKNTDLNNVSIRGVMGMATFTDDKSQVRNEFKKLKSIFDLLKEKHFSENNEFKEISMGMSGDYKIALEEGSTIVRLGSVLFE